MTAKPSPASDDPLYDGHDLEALFELINYQRWIAALITPYMGRHAVEFGAGIGAMSRWLVSPVDRIDLVEPSPNLLGRLSERFAGDKRVHVVPSSLDTYVAAQPEQSLDSAVLINLLEHIDDDVTALRKIGRVLRPGGHLLVFVPAMPSLYSRLDEILGHHRRYTRKNLSGIAEAADFEIVTLRYFDLLGVLPWWLINTLGRKESFDAGLSRLYDRVCVPVSRLLESLASPPIGKNLLLVARRPGP